MATRRVAVSRAACRQISLVTGVTWHLRSLATRSTGRSSTTRQRASSWATCKDPSTAQSASRTHRRRCHRHPRPHRRLRRRRRRRRPHRRRHRRRHITVVAACPAGQSCYNLRHQYCTTIASLFLAATVPAAVSRRATITAAIAPPSPPPCRRRFSPLRSAAIRVEVARAATSIR